MEIEFVTEPNLKIKFRHSKFWGTLKLFVNGTKAKIKHLPHISKDLTRSMGTKVENREFRVDITRPQILAPFRKGWQYTFFIDGKKVKDVIEQ